MFRSKGNDFYEPEMTNPLHIENPSKDTMSHIPKGVLKRSTYNLDAHASQNYNIVEYLDQAPCEMSTLDVL